VQDLCRPLLCAGLLLACLLPAPTRAAPPAMPWQRFFITGYKDVGLTATGTQARWGEVAVDPRVVPLGSWIRIQPYRTIFRAEDTGGLIVGRRADIWFPTAAQCYAATGWHLLRWSKHKADLR
jgi:3D (Asp-Asp-Asp) domain-containing protein